MTDTMSNIVYNVGALILAGIIVGIWVSIMLFAVITSGIVSICHHIGEGGNDG